MSFGFGISHYRLPSASRSWSAGTAVPNTPFTMVYELYDEYAIELASRTVHDICHLGWVPTDDGEYELRMAALVKPNGLFGRLYMPQSSRSDLIVYPALTRKWERTWRNRDRHSGSGARTTASPGPTRYPEIAAVPPGAHNQGEPHRAAPRHEWRVQMIKWAGRLIVLYGTAHTLGALTVEGAARHAGAWFSGELWGDDLANMSPAMSAYWLSVNSFGPPLILLGLTVLWLDRRGITPPPFIAWTLGIWTVVDAVLAGPGAGQGLILLLAVGLLLAGARRAARRVNPAPHAEMRYTTQ